MKIYKMIFLFFITPALLFSEIGKVIKSIPLPIEQPYGLSKDGNFLLISDRATSNLYYFSIPQEQIKDKRKLPFKKLTGIVKDDGGLWVIDSEKKKIFHFNLKEEKVDKVLEDLETEPFSIAFDGENLWATAKGKFFKIDASDGTIIDSFSGLSSSPEGIHFDGKYLWITDRINDKIYVANREGEIFGVLPSPAPYPTGILRDKDILYVLDFQEKALYLMDISFNEKPYYLGKSYKRKIKFSHSLCNKGPSSEVFGSIFIAIPEEDKHQKFLSPLKFHPEKYNVKKDRWGQKFATLEGKIENDGCLKIDYTTEVETFDLNYFIFPEWVQGLEAIPEEIKREYTIDGKKLDINNQYIKDLLKNIIKDEKNPFWIAFKIHKYLHTNIKYEMTGGWNKASTVLKRGNGSCSEFTFSFIALARAAGLPARYEAGIVVRGDDSSIDNVYHRWAEVYLPPFGWIPVDPSKGMPATPLDVVNSFGSLSHRFFITTHSGGDSEYLGWNYNSYHKYEYKGEAEVYFITEAKWDQIK
ncbi:MAG: transglutaminase domain-containing protein [Thermoanaerobaculia bacterium]